MFGNEFLILEYEPKDISEVIVALAIERHVDVLILSECEIAPAKLLLALNAGKDVCFHLTESLSKAALVITRFSGDFLEKRYESKRLSIRSLKLPAAAPILVAHGEFSE
jgi:hypothetical protein